jgi:hypothetical protein
MAGSCTTKKIPLTEEYTVYSFEWTSNSAGAVNGVGGISVDGLILGVQFKSDPTNIPTTAYDVQLQTAGGQDMLMNTGVSGLGSNIASAITDIATQFRKPTNIDGGNVMVFGETLSPVITNAGNATHGWIYLHVWGKIKL